MKRAVIIFFVVFMEMIGTLRAFDYEDFQPLVDKRSGSASDEMSPEELDLCTMGSVPQIVNMKRMISMDSRRAKRTGNVSMSQWRLMQWTRQLQDLERYLAFCNRRNNVSKIRLL